MEPGSVLLMSDRVCHCSQGNASQQTRRVYMVQYSTGIVPADDHTANMPLALAVPIQNE
jgi:ectoine hydroxylase-related dioxygenase (phytanoyl-CoA dioxygenase family)